MAWGLEGQNYRLFRTHMRRGECLPYKQGLAEHLAAHSQNTRNVHRPQGGGWAGKGGVRIFKLAAFLKSDLRLTNWKL